MEPLVTIIMGSKTDWPIMEHAALTLDKFNIPYEVKVISAHRAPDALFSYVQELEGRGVEVVIAGAGGAAHLPGVIAAKTIIPVLGVPMQTEALHGMDSVLSILQMPAGIPVGTLAIGKAGTINAALLAVAILGNKYPDYRKALYEFRKNQTQKIVDNSDPRKG